MADTDNSSTRGVTHQELLRRAARAEIAEGVRSLIPARVERYDADQQQIDAKPLVKDFHRDESGARVVDSVPVITNVPVMFLTAGGFTFTVPIIAGETTGALLFSDRSLDRWLSGDGAEVDPEIYVRNSLTDGIFIPGLLTFAAPMAAPPTDHAFAGKAGGVGIHFRDSTIIVGDEAGSDWMALAGKTKANDDAIWNLLDGVFGAASAPIVTPAVGAPDPVYVAVKAAIAAAIIAASLPPASVAASQGKTK